MAERTDVYLVDGKCEGNPFDVILHSALEFARTAYWFNTRYRNADVPKQFRDNFLGEFEMYYERLRKQFTILENIPEDELKICRETSAIANDSKSRRYNDFLYENSSALQTIWSKCYPFLEPVFEDLVYGKGSEICERHRILRDVVYEFIDIEHISNYVDIINNGKEYCMKHWGYFWDDETADRFLYDIAKFNLTEDDCNYLHAYKEYLENKAKLAEQEVIL